MTVDNYEMDRFDPLYYGNSGAAKDPAAIIRMLQAAGTAATRRGDTVRFSPYAYHEHPETGETTEWDAATAAGRLQEAAKTLPPGQSAMDLTDAYPAYYSLTRGGKSRGQHPLAAALRAADTQKAAEDTGAAVGNPGITGRHNLPPKLPPPRFEGQPVPRPQGLAQTVRTMGRLVPGALNGVIQDIGNNSWRGDAATRATATGLDNLQGHGEVAPLPGLPQHQGPAWAMSAGGVALGQAAHEQNQPGPVVSPPWQQRRAIPAEAIGNADQPQSSAVDAFIARQLAVQQGRHSNRGWVGHTPGASEDVMREMLRRRSLAPRIDSHRSDPLPAPGIAPLAPGQLPPPDFTKQNAMKTADDAQARRDTLLALLTIAGGGMGAGMVGRGLLGAKDLLNPPEFDPLMHTSPVATPLPVPIRAKPRRKRAVPVVPGLQKVADNPFGTSPGAFGGSAVPPGSTRQLGGASAPLPAPTGAAVGNPGITGRHNLPPKPLDLPPARFSHQPPVVGPQQPLSPESVQRSQRIAGGTGVGQAGYERITERNPAVHRPHPNDPGIVREPHAELPIPPGAVRGGTAIPPLLGQARGEGQTPWVGNLYADIYGQSIARRPDSDTLVDQAALSATGPMNNLAGHMRFGSSTSFPAIPAQPAAAPQPAPAAAPQPAPAAGAGEIPQIKQASPDPAKSDWFQSIADTIIPTPTTTNPLASSWGTPTALTVAAGGLGGGWKLMDWLAKRGKSQDIGSALSHAEEEYQQALVEQYQAAMRNKKAGDDLGIDSVYEKVAAEKKALLSNIPGVSQVENAILAIPKLLFGNDRIEALNGVANAAALTAAGVGGYGTYNWVKQRNKQRLLEKAIALRARQRQFSPAPFYAVPEVINVEDAGAA